MTTHGGAGTSWAASFPLRAVAAVVPFGMILLALLETVVITGFATHLCGWPARLACQRGVPGVWTALIVSLWLCVVVAMADVWGFHAAPDRDAAGRIVAWAVWGPTLIVATGVAGSDSELAMGDLLVGAALLLVALVLIGKTLASRLRIPERRVALLLSPLALVVGLVPLWAPPAFTAAHDAKPPGESFYLSVVSPGQACRSSACAQDAYAAWMPSA